MRIAGEIVGKQLKKRTEVVDGVECTSECVIVTVEVERDGFKAKSQLIIDVAEQNDWQIGGTAGVEIAVLQQEDEAPDREHMTSRGGGTRPVSGIRAKEKAVLPGRHSFNVTPT